MLLSFLKGRNVDPVDSRVLVGGDPHGLHIITADWHLLPFVLMLANADEAQGGGGERGCHNVMLVSGFGRDHVFQLGFR